MLKVGELRKILENYDDDNVYLFLPDPDIVKCDDDDDDILYYIAKGWAFEIDKVNTNPCSVELVFSDYRR